MMRAGFLTAFSAALSLLAPSAASAAAMGPAALFQYADRTAQFIMLGLIVASLVAVGIVVRKIAAGPGLTGGSAYIAALRLGGPLVGLLGATYTVFNLFIALANVGSDFPLAVYAPGVAEGLLVLIIGLMTGVVGVVCHAVLEGRIDRAVLKS